MKSFNKKGLLIGGSVLLGVAGVALSVKAVTKAKQINKEMEEMQDTVDQANETHKGEREVLEQIDLSIYTEEERKELEKSANAYTDEDYANDCDIVNKKRIAKHIINVTPAVVCILVAGRLVIKGIKMEANGGESNE